MTKTEQQMILGVVWLILGVWFAVATQVWVGIVMCALGVFYLAYAIRRQGEPSTLTDSEN